MINHAGALRRSVRAAAALSAMLGSLVASSAVFSQDAPPPTQPAPSTQPPAAPPPVTDPAAGDPAPPETGAKSKISTAENNALANEITPELDAAVTRGLAWLATQQTEDGSFGAGRYGKNVAITALAGLAFMGDGNTPSRGPYSKQVRGALEFVISSSTETGLLAADSTNGPMYGHGFATLFLGEAYGMLPGGADTELANRTHETLVKAVRLIEQTQNEEGGWRYNPVPYDADISVTICQIMAMRSARNAGLEVPKETIDKAVDYVRRCQNPDGGFKYQLTTGFSAFPRSAAGVASLYYAGIYEDDAIDKGIRYLLENGAGNDESRGMAHYFYGQYYAVQAMYLAGGQPWATWWPMIRSELLSKQKDDGSWDDPSVGESYGTSMALIILQMPKRYLPIFQK